MFSVVIFQTNYTSYATLLDLKGIKFLDYLVKSLVLWYIYCINPFGKYLYKAI